MARNESGYKIYGTHHGKPSKIIKMSQTDPSKKYVLYGYFCKSFYPKYLDALQIDCEEAVVI